MNQDPHLFQARDHYVALQKQQSFDPDVMCSLLRDCSLLKAEIKRSLRRQRGFLFGRLTEEEASKIAETLTRAGIEAMAIPVEDAERGPKPRRITRVEVMDDGFYFPSAAAVGETAFIPGDEIRFLSFGLVSPTSALESVVDDPVAFAASAFQATQASGPFIREPFPLAAYLLQDPEDAVNMERLIPKAKPQKSKKVKGIIKRFRRFEDEADAPRYKSEHPQLSGRMWLSTDNIDMVLDTEGALFERRDPSSFGHWIKPFHALAIDATLAVAHANGLEALPSPEIVDGKALFRPMMLDKCTIPEGTLAFALAHDDASYLF
ncbi:MAG: hypothetical protein KDB07_09590 [Planctomycetes bacterium]|nr:hypothetical protein [Planctomycetota bacterium]